MELDDGPLTLCCAPGSIVRPTLNQRRRYARVALVPAFISFDFDHDLDCKNLLIGQARNPDSPFQIADHSMKVASSGWKEEARRRIRRVELVIVICGEYTHTATGVNEEIRIARSELKPYFLLNGRPHGIHRKPTAALDRDKVYEWTWENLKKLIAGGR
jgi:hypothetical protein